MSRRQIELLLSLFIFSVCLTIWAPVSITVGGLNLRASQLLLPVVIGALAWLQRRPHVSVWSLLTVAGGILWWAALVGWTLVNGPQYGHPFGRVVLMALNLLQGLAAYLLIVRLGDPRVPVRAILWSVTLLNLMLVAISAASALGLPISERWLAPEAAPLYVNGEIVSGTVQRFIASGVLAGCVSASTAVLAICLWFDPAWRGRWLLGVAAVVALLGMIIGFSRQSIVSLVVGLAVTSPFMFGPGRMLRLLKLTAIGGVLTAIALALVLATPPGRQFWYAFAGRTAQFFDPEAYRTGTAGGRAEIWTGMGRDIARNPFVGQGQDSYLRYMGPEEEGAHNFPVEVLHSTGLIGFVGYLVMHAVAPIAAVGLLIGWRLRENDRAPLVAMLGGYAAMVAASVTNIIYWNPTYWLFLGMMVAAVRVTGRPRTLLGALDV